MSIFDVSASTLFIASASQAGRMQNLGLRALNNGLELYVAKKYDEAIASFKRAASLDPKSSTSSNAYEYMARSYTQMGNNKSAISTYQESLRQDPNQSWIHLALGNLLFSEDRLEEAVRSYEKATNLDPSATNRYSLGQGYLAVGRYEEAERQFEQAKKMTPREPQGDVGLGQAYAKQGRGDDAIRAFQQAIDVQRDYWTAYSEMGYALVDNGDLDQAREIVETLEPKAAGLADSLSQYIYEKAPPKLTAAYTDDQFTSFSISKGPGTILTDLTASLSAPGSQHLFSMIFQFSKPMDRESVQDVGNWTISRAQSANLADTYNFGNLIPATEVMPPSTPTLVFYNETYRTATLVFNMTQNDQGNGTIDPSHIQFSFNGKDVLGISMDLANDDYSGFSGFA